MGQIAEMLTGDGQQLLITETTVIEGFDTNNPIQQIAMVSLQMLQEQLPHVVGPTTMAQEQHHIGSGDGGGDAGEVVVIDGRSLTGLIPIMAMAEILIRPPDAVGLEHGMLHLISLQPEHIGVAMIEMQDQPVTLIPPWGRFIGLPCRASAAWSWWRWARPTWIAS